MFGHGHAIPTPSPVELGGGSGEQVDAYMALAGRAGAANSIAFLNLSIRRSLHRHGIPIYPLDAVNRVLNAEATRLGKAWAWHPVRVLDREGKLAFGDHGGTAEPLYRRAIPSHALEKIALVASDVPAARFFINDVAVPRPDPFLLVCGNIGGAEDLIIDHWDEPGFDFTRLLQGEGPRN